MNDALAFFDKNLNEQRIAGSKIVNVLTYGRWRGSWRDDILARHKLTTEHPADAILAFYEDAALQSFGYLRHMGFYLEVTKEEITPARNRMTRSGYKDVTVLVDGNQRYILARKQGR